MNPLSLNNIFGHGYEEEHFTAFKQAGFTFRSQNSSFAGAQHLHFIDFQNPPCLELIEVSDHQVYRDFVPPGMEPYAPGLNLRIPEQSQPSIETLRVRFAHWEPYLLHENYQGGQEEHQPGWNYLNFRQPLMPGVFIWVTEFEPPYPATHPRTTHTNTVSRVSGMIFDLPADHFTNLSALIEQPVRRGVLDLNGIQLFSRDAARLDRPLPEKVFPLSAVVLEAETLEFFLAMDPRPAQLTYQGKQAVWITTPPRCWDLLVTT